MEHKDLAWWLDRVPNLKLVGTQYEGPCPLCGGTDRFFLKANGTMPAYCRQCGEKPDFYKELFEVLEPSERGAQAQQITSDMVALPVDGEYDIEHVKSWPVWIVSYKKGPAKAPLQINGEGYSQSRPEGARLSRYGGRASDRPFDIKPWTTYDRAAEVAEVAVGFEGYESSRPAICLTGDQDCPYPLDLIILDFDYKKDKDDQGLGMLWRDSLSATLANRGTPIWSSMSGSGFHAFMRAENLAEWLPKKGRWPVEREKTIHGASVDLFAAGAKNLVVPCFDMPIANMEYDLPRFGEREITDMINFTVPK